MLRGSDSGRQEASPGRQEAVLADRKESRQTGSNPARQEEAILADRKQFWQTGSSS